MLNKGVSTSLFQKSYAFHAVSLEELEVSFPWRVKDEGDIQKCDSVIEKRNCLKKMRYYRDVFLEAFLPRRKLANRMVPSLPRKGVPSQEVLRMAEVAMWY